MKPTNVFPGGTTSAPVNNGYPSQRAPGGTNGLSPPSGYPSGFSAQPFFGTSHMPPQHSYSGTVMSATMSAWSGWETQRVEPSLVEDEMSEVAEALRGWAKLRAAHAVGPLYVRNVDLGGSRGSRGDLDVLTLQLDPGITRSTSTISRKQVGAHAAAAAKKLPAGSRVWIIVEE